MDPAERGAFLERPPSDAPSLDDAHEVGLSATADKCTITQWPAHAGFVRQERKRSCLTCGHPKALSELMHERDPLHARKGSIMQLHPQGMQPSS
jgi:hypothetical protein